MVSEFVSIVSVLLSTLVTSHGKTWGPSPSSPYYLMTAGSEQRRPVFFGHSPLELAQNQYPKRSTILLPQNLKALAEKEVALISTQIPSKEFEVEAWPFLDDFGKRSWVFARYRLSSIQAWEWLQTSHSVYYTKDKTHFFQLFSDISEGSDLYFKPLFGDCVWTSESGDESLGAWYHPDEREEFERNLKGDLACHYLPQPARFDGTPFSLILSVNDGKITWPKNLDWVSDLSEVSVPVKTPEKKITSWPVDFVSKFKEDLLFFVNRYTRKTNSDPQNQLEEIADHLEGHYKKLGVKTIRQRFEWRGILQSNIIAVIPGSLPKEKNKPVALVDHFDTAFAEDVFHKTGERVSNPGADDNSSGTATLLRAADILKDSKPQHDVWLVHMTGEEFPGDDLGARHFVAKLLEEKRDMSGFIVVDMISHRNPADGIFQINPGSSPQSIAIGSLAMSLSSNIVEPWMTPVLRPMFDDKSYLYNTDGLIFEEVGYPVVLLNEHINRWENYGEPGNHRSGYHRSDDNSSNVDFVYGAAIARLAIEVAAQISARN